jgi:hypothetical protein
MCLSDLKIIDHADGNPDFFEAGYCLGAIHSLRSMTYTIAREFGWRHICIPIEAQDNQAVRVVVKFLRNNPARMHEQFEALVYAAFSDAWPCRD